MRRYAGTYFVDDTRYQNVGIGSDPKVRQTYWRAFTVMFASVRRFDPEADLVLYTNDRPTPEIQLLLEAIGVRVEALAFTFEVPRGYFHEFGGSFLLLDAIRHTAQESADDDVLVILDPDCLLVRSPDQLLAPLAQGAAWSLLRIGYEPDRVRMGMSRNGFGETFGQAAGRQVQAPPSWIGGEFVAVTGRGARSVLPDLQRAWDFSIAAHASGQTPPPLTTEEGVLAFAAWADPGRIAWADAWVARIWTSPLERSVTGEELDSLVVWHLPAEKDRGFRRLHQDLRKDPGMLSTLDDDQVRAHLARRTGIDRSVTRRAHDVAWAGAWRLRASLRG